MFSHVFIGVHDFERTFAFYDPIMSALGLSLRFYDQSRPWAGWQMATDSRPLFLIGTPDNGQPHEVGNGQMVAFTANCREMVDQVYNLALAQGGVCEGKPDLRPHYHAHYYGAYFRDSEGNKICVVCHAQPDAE
jgi:catechol 2,3-dioxygenase-like lactoylglutathione lyase family enzyme